MVVVMHAQSIPGPRVIGFNLTTTGKYNIDSKRVDNLDTQDDHKVDDDYNDIVKDLKSAVNKEYVNDKLPKKVKVGNYYDLRNFKIKFLKYIIMACIKTEISYQKNMLT